MVFRHGRLECRGVGEGAEGSQTWSMWMIASSTWHSLRTHHLHRGSFLAISPPDVKIIICIWLEFLGDSFFSSLFFTLLLSLPPVFNPHFFSSHVSYSQIVSASRYREEAPVNPSLSAGCWGIFPGTYSILGWAGPSNRGVSSDLELARKFSTA